jgi:lambda repressor-like predicted transcriptional regulator
MAVDAKQLVEALEVATRMGTHAAFLRDQVMVALRDHGVSLRQIAAHTTIDYTTVDKVVKRTTAVKDIELILPAPLKLQIEVASPADLVAELKERYTEHPPVPTDVLAHNLNALTKNFPPPDFGPPPGFRPPPNWRWHIVGMERLLQHALGDRATLAPEEAAAQYRLVVLIGLWRKAEGVGYADPAMAQQRDDWMDALGRLVAHAP